MVGAAPTASAARSVALKGSREEIRRSPSVRRRMERSKVFGV